MFTKRSPVFYVYISLACSVSLCCICAKNVERSSEKTNMEKTQAEKKPSYIDPFDMLNYDPVSKTMMRDADEPVVIQTEKNFLNELESEVPDNAVNNLESNESEGSHRVSDHKTDHNEFCPDSSRTTPDEDRARKFLLRFVRILYQTMQLQGRSIGIDEKIHIPLTARISGRYLDILRTYLEQEDGGMHNRVRLADLDEVFSNLFFLENEMPPQDTNWDFTLNFIRNVYMHPKDLIGVVLLALPCMAFFMAARQYPFKHIILSVLSLGFLVDVFWNWNQLYQQAISKRESDSMKYSTLPRECQPAELNMWDKAKIYVTGVDPCEKYHEVLMTDPVYSVSVMAAFSESFAKLVFHPVEYIGNRMGRFFAGVLGTQNIVDRYIVLVVVLFLVMYILALVFRYQLSFPFWMGGIGPSSKPAVEKPPPPTPPPVVQQPQQQLPQQPLVVVLRVGAEALVQGSGSRVQIVEQVQSATILERLTSQTEPEVLQALEATEVETKEATEVETKEATEVGSKETTDSSDKSK